MHRLKDVIREEPKIIHISCHGIDPNKGYYLKFEEQGQTRKFYEKELGGILSQLSEKLKKIDLVVLSSCNIENEGNLFVKCVFKNVINFKKNYKI